jgi:hypothetical protein
MVIAGVAAESPRAGRAASHLVNFAKTGLGAEARTG